MDAQLETKLINCLSALESGESLEQILSRYPEDAAHLRVLLEIAASLPLVRLEASPVAQVASRRAFLAEAQMIRDTSERRPFTLFPVRLAAVLASLVLVFVFVGSVVAASAAALPGDRLYEVKRGVEEIRLNLASAAQKEQLAKQFEQERRDEIVALLGIDREAEVGFSGPIESIQPGAWRVAAVDIGVSADTRVAGLPLIGRNAYIVGRTSHGRVLAVSIVIEPSRTPPVTPTSSPAPTAIATSTKAPTATSRPTLTPTPVPTDTSIPTETPMPTDTPSARPRPTAEPRPAAAPTSAPSLTDTPTPGEDNQNGGDGQNGDDHGGDGGSNDGGDHGGDGGSNDGGGDSGGDHGGDGGSNDSGGDSGGDHSGSGKDGGGGDSGDHSGSSDH
jgi:uncharacterized membrane protein YgcG